MDLTSDQASPSEFFDVSAQERRRRTRLVSVRLPEELVLRLAVVGNGEGMTMSADWVRSSPPRRRGRKRRRSELRVNNTLLVAQISQISAVATNRVTAADQAICREYPTRVMSWPSDPNRQGSRFRGPNRPCLRSDCPGWAIEAAGWPGASFASTSIQAGAVSSLATLYPPSRGCVVAHSSASVTVANGPTMDCGAMFAGPWSTTADM